MHLENTDQHRVQCLAAERLTCRLFLRRLQDFGPVCESQPLLSPSSQCGLEEWRRDAGDRWRRSRRSGPDAAADTWNGVLFSIELLTHWRHLLDG